MGRDRVPAVEEDGSFEVSAVTKTIDSSFDGHDFAVESFGHSIGDVVRALADDIHQALFDGASDGLYRFQPCTNHSLVPLVKEVRRGLRGVLAPEISEHFFEAPGFPGLQLQRERLFEF